MLPTKARRNTLKLEAKDDDECRLVVGKKAGDFTLASLEEQRKDKHLCDITLMVSGKEIVAHRSILIIHSDYFKHMFTDGFHESHVSEIKLSGLDWVSASKLVDFMYTGKLKVTADTVQGLIMASDLWQMVLIKDMCAEYMEQQITAQNCLGVLSFAELYTCDRLRQYSLLMIKQRFPTVAQCEEFLELSRDRLEEILSFGDLFLGCEGEDVVLRAAVRWLDKHHKEMIDVSSLMSKVRLSQTSCKCRIEILTQNKVVQEHEELKALLTETIEEGKGRRIAHTSLYVIGGFLQSRTGPKCPRLQTVERYDPITNSWMQCAEFPMRSSGAVAFSILGHLLCCAFESVDRVSSDVTASQTKIFEYSILLDKWLDVMNQFSTDCCQCLDSCLQAEGAVAVCHKTNTIYTVSHCQVCCMPVHLIEDDVCVRTMQHPPLPPRACFTDKHRLHCAVVVNRSLYVLGGDRHDAGMDPVPTSSVVMLDLDVSQDKSCSTLPQWKPWRSCTPMLEARARLAAVELNGKIYACGGFNTRRLSTVECYNPETDQWTALQHMEKYRSHHQLLILDNRIWALGGKSYAFNNGGARKVLGVCEVYNPDTNTWSEGQPMKSARCGFAAVAI